MSKNVFKEVNIAANSHDDPIGKKIKKLAINTKFNS